jgi:hypothetical protein
MFLFILLTFSLLFKLVYFFNQAAFASDHSPSLTPLRNLVPTESDEGLRNPAYIPPLPRGLIAWFMPTLDMTDGKIYNARGPDAVRNKRIEGNC